MTVPNATDLGAQRPRRRQTPRCVYFTSFIDGAKRCLRLGQRNSGAEQGGPAVWVRGPSPVGSPGHGPRGPRGLTTMPALTHAPGQREAQEGRCAHFPAARLNLPAAWAAGAAGAAGGGQLRPPGPRLLALRSPGPLAGRGRQALVVRRPEPGTARPFWSRRRRREGGKGHRWPDKWPSAWLRGRGAGRTAPRGSAGPAGV